MDYEETGGAEERTRAAQMLLGFAEGLQIDAELLDIDGNTMTVSVLGSNRAFSL